MPTPRSWWPTEGMNRRRSRPSRARARNVAGTEREPDGAAARDARGRLLRIRSCRSTTASSDRGPSRAGPRRSLTSHTKTPRPRCAGSPRGRIAVASLAPVRRGDFCTAPYEDPGGSATSRRRDSLLKGAAFDTIETCEKPDVAPPLPAAVLSPPHWSVMQVLRGGLSEKRLTLVNGIRRRAPRHRSRAVIPRRSGGTAPPILGRTLATRGRMVLRG